jgi:hypothetical protein
MKFWVPMMVAVGATLTLWKAARVTPPPGLACTVMPGLTVTSPVGGPLVGFAASRSTPPLLETFMAATRGPVLPTRVLRPLLEQAVMPSTAVMVRGWLLLM